jgi:hypothetical protein
MRIQLKSMLCVSAVCTVLGVSSCVAMPEGSPGVALDGGGQSGQDAVLKSPSMIREAKLPLGFPPPGPVDRVILKEYPAYRAARVEAADGQKDAAGKMFRPLFQHIKKNNIAMTAPVEMTYKSDAAGEEAQPVAMAFLYGSPQTGEVARQGDVEVIDLPAQKVISVAVRGGYEKGFAAGLEQLQNWLSQHPDRFEVVGSPRFLGYNSPFVPWFLRIGEVQLPVKPVSEVQRKSSTGALSTR